MGIARRLFTLAKAYITVTSERLERASREVETEEKLKEASRLSEDASRAERELGAALPVSPAPASRVSYPLAEDYKLLGVPYNSELSVVEDSWRKLAQRADPKRFPAGSAEERRAAEIMSRINAAYGRIREAKHPTEGRFGKLEI